MHPVGDLQQPLHTVDATGTGIGVLFGGRPSELHRVWDGQIIADYGGAPDSIDREIAPLAARLPSGGGPRDWAEEGRAIAQSNIYAKIDPHSRSEVDLPSNYAQMRWPSSRAGSSKGATASRSF